MSDAFEHLGSEVGHTPAEGFGSIVVEHTLLRESEVSKHGMPIDIEDDVFGLQVAVDDIILVEVLQGREDLGYVNSCILFWNSMI